MSAVVSAKVDVALAYEQRADAGAVAVLRRLLTVIADNTEGSITGSDNEHLHQLRIAVRRSRTVQRQLAGVFPAGVLPGFRSEFRWLQQATGDARDLDVYLAELDSLRQLLDPAMRSELDPLAQVLVRRRDAARAHLRHSLTSVRAAALYDDWERLLETLVELPVDDRPAALQSIGELVGLRVRRVYKRIVQMGRAIDADSPAESYHELRKRGKELRYLVELFGIRLFGEERVAPMVRSLKALQDVLGRHQDREIQVMMLRSAAPEVALAPGGAGACLAMGVLVDRLRSDEHAARAEFRERFEQLAAGEQRTLVRETFR